MKGRPFVSRGRLRNTKGHPFILRGRLCMLRGRLCNTKGYTFILRGRLRNMKGCAFILRGRLCNMKVYPFVLRGRPYKLIKPQSGSLNRLLICRCPGFLTYNAVMIPFNTLKKTLQCFLRMIPTRLKYGNTTFDTVRRVTEIRI
jgi:hypothetical protein